MTKSIIRSAISALVAFALVFGTVAIAPTRTSAASLSTSINGLFPKSVGGIPLRRHEKLRLRKISWISPGSTARCNLSKFRQFERFLGSSGVDPNSPGRRDHFMQIRLSAAEVLTTSSASRSANSILPR